MRLKTHTNLPRYVQPKNKVPLKWFIWEPRELLNFLSALSKTFLIAHTFSIYSSSNIFPSNLCFSSVIISSIFLFSWLFKITVSSYFPHIIHMFHSVAITIIITYNEYICLHCLFANYYIFNMLITIVLTPKPISLMIFSCFWLLNWN